MQKSSTIKTRIFRTQNENWQWRQATLRERERVRYTKARYRYCRYICTIYITICFADYVGFIKKIMKLLQHGYGEVQSIEIELRILEETSAPPSRPRKLYQTLSKHFFPSLFLSLSIYLYIYISLYNTMYLGVHWVCVCAWGYSARRVHHLLLRGLQSQVRGGAARPAENRWRRQSDEGHLAGHVHRSVERATQMMIVNNKWQHDANLTPSNSSLVLRSLF